MVSFFDSQSSKLVTASVDGLVTIKMTGRFHVESLTLHQKTATAELARLEQTIASAFNQAIGKVLKNNTDHLIASLAGC
jgi:DNA-binding protein YbaB